MAVGAQPPLESATDVPQAVTQADMGKVAHTSTHVRCNTQGACWAGGQGSAFRCTALVWARDCCGCSCYTRQQLATGVVHKYGNCVAHCRP